VDLRRAPIPWDCRAGTGPGALERFREVIRLFREDGVRFLRISEAARADMQGSEEPR